MIVPYYVGIFSPPDCCSPQATQLMPLTSAEGLKGSAPSAAALGVNLGVGMGMGVGVGGSSLPVMTNEMLTYVSAVSSPGGGGSPGLITAGGGGGGLTTSVATTSPVSSAPLSPAASMELVWHGEYDRLFRQYFPHTWYLIPTFYPPTERWNIFKDSAKVRFSCAECGHGWTSMKGRVIFWFHMNYAANAGYVLFKLYGQQCQKCNNGKFEHAMWYPEEVVKVIGNVYNRVGQCYYGFVRPPLRIDRRQGKPRNQHNAELCQACKEGLCKEEWTVAASS